MAITNSDLIRESLRLIRVLGVFEPIPPEMSTDAVPVMNRMLAEWKERRGIDLNYSAQTVADLGLECPIPEDAELAVIYYLAFALAPKYGKTPSQEMVDLANTYYSSLRRDAQAALMREARLDHLSAGSGHDNQTFDIIRGV